MHRGYTQRDAPGPEPIRPRLQIVTAQHTETNSFEPAKPFDYSGNDGAAYHEHRQLPRRAEEWIARVRAGKIQPFIKATDSVFEYGVGFGWNLMALNCASKAGYDVAPGLAPLARQRGIQFADNLEVLPSESFDVVICHHTLEHLQSPAAALRTIFRLLNKAGTLLLFVPYEIERKYRRYNASDMAHHLYSWNPSTLANLVLAQGFALSSVGLRRFRFDRMAALAALRLRAGEKGYRFIRRVGQLLLPEYEIALVANK